MAETADHPPAPSATYTVGYEEAVIRLFERRTLAGCAGFVLPHLRPGMTVLDCGCGPGSLTSEIAERVAPGQVVGIDIETRQFPQAQALAAVRGLTNLRFEQADVYALPFPDAAFDAVFSHALLSHLREPVRAFAESRRVLKPDGVLAVSESDNGTWAISPPGSAMERVLALYVRVLAHNGGNRLLARHLRGVLLEAGFARAEARSASEAWGTPEDTRVLAVAMAGIASSPGFVGTVLGQGWADQAELDALPAALLAWGERPDACVAVLKGGALGWLSSR